jgi:hypothetical protein
MVSYTIHRWLWAVRADLADICENVDDEADVANVESRKCKANDAKVTDALLEWLVACLARRGFVRCTLTDLHVSIRRMTQSKLSKNLSPSEGLVRREEQECDYFRYQKAS